jgi:hypothetical protein
MELIRLVCPWGRKTPNLGGKKLSISEKTWLICEVAHHGAESIVLSKNYTIARGTLNKWVHNYIKKGFITVLKGKRPIMNSNSLLNWRGSSISGIAGFF